MTAAPTGRAGRTSTTLAADLRTALDALDEPAAQAVLDRLMSDFTLAATLRDVVVPYLRELGERWANGEVTIIQEHFASNVIRGRLAGLARGWGNGDGPRAVLACPPGELHDLPLLIFGIILNRRGWRVDFFGANTPVVEVIDGARRSPPDLIVVAATAPERLTAISADLAHLAAVAPLALAGAGASPDGGRRGRRRVAHRRPSHRGRAATAPTAAVSVRHGSRDDAEATGPADLLGGGKGLSSATRLRPARAPVRGSRRRSRRRHRP